MQQGKIKFFNSEKAYGFIIPEDGSGDIFIHMNEVEKSGYKGINIGQRVSYELGTNHKGKQQAVNIKIIG